MEETIESPLDQALSARSLEARIKEYYNLNSQCKQLSKHLEMEGQRIKKDIIAAHGEVHPGAVLEHVGTDDECVYTAKVQMKQRRLKVDRGALEQLIVDKNLWAEATRRQLDYDLVEQLFIEGKIIDEDLRSINGGSTVTPTLIVERSDV